MKEVATPTYIVDVQRFESNFERLKESFKKHYSNVHIGYSYKTNPTPILCRKVNEIGEFAEIVSPLEYQHAIHIGVPKNRIIYNGVIPDFANKLDLCLNGGYVNVENISELIPFYEYSERTRTVIKVGVRLTFDFGKYNPFRFGFDINGKEFIELLKIQRKANYLIINGIHCHISDGREVRYWVARANKMIELSKLFDTEYIDLGGNMYGEMEKSLADQFPETTTYKQYADAIAPLFAKAFPSHDVTLFLENGTSVVADCMFILTQVISRKESATKTIFTLDSSVYDFGFLIKTKIPPYTVYNCSETSEQVDNALICGYTCTNEDVILKDFTGQLSVGDKILFRNVGAYSVAFASDFIQPKLGIISLQNLNGAVTKRANYNDIFSLNKS